MPSNKEIFNSITTSFFKNSFGIELPTKVDMPLNKEANQPNQRSSNLIAFRLDVAQGRRNGAPSNAQTHTCRFASQTH